MELSSIPTSPFLHLPLPLFTSTLSPSLHHVISVTRWQRDPGVFVEQKWPSISLVFLKQCVLPNTKSQGTTAVTIPLSHTQMNGTQHTNSNQSNHSNSSIDKNHVKIFKEWSHKFYYKRILKLNLNKWTNNRNTKWNDNIDKMVDNIPVSGETR
jgi:hypothetical protein